MQRVRPMLALFLLLTAQVASASLCRDQVRALLSVPEPPREYAEEAAEVCAAAHRQGEAIAGYHLALLYLGVLDWEPERATPLVREAARSGVPEAQYWLAWQLEEGPLLPNDPAAALSWYEAAAAQSHQLALLRLAEAYEAGELGLGVQPQRAIELRAMAASCETEGD